MMMNAWKAISEVSPTASSEVKESLARCARRSPLPASSRNAQSTAVAPNSPSSSPMTAKMKSDSS